MDFRGVFHGLAIWRREPLPVASPLFLSISIVRLRRVIFGKRAAEAKAIFTFPH
jgi:hypothetical protein